MNNELYKVSIHDQITAVELSQEVDSVTKVLVEDKIYRSRWDKDSTNTLFIDDNKLSVDNFIFSGNELIKITINQKTYPVNLERGLPRGFKSKAKSTSANGANVIKAPMPGMIVDIPVHVGDEVKEGDLLIVIEAMKMENHIKSAVTGKIQSIKHKAGDTCNANEVLITLE